jgi:hypothetical protein
MARTTRRLSKEDLERWDAVRHLRKLASHPEDQNVLPPGMVIDQVRVLAAAIESLFESDSVQPRQGDLTKADPGYAVS